MEYPVLSHADLDRLHDEMVAGVWVRPVLDDGGVTVRWTMRESWFRRLFDLWANYPPWLIVMPDAPSFVRVQLFQGFANPTGSAFAADCPLWLDARARAVIASQAKE